MNKCGTELVYDTGIATDASLIKTFLITNNLSCTNISIFKQTNKQVTTKQNVAVTLLIAHYYLVSLFILKVLYFK